MSKCTCKHSVQLNVWFLPKVSNIFLYPLPLFFVFITTVVQNCWPWWLLVFELLQVHASFMHCVYSHVKTASWNVYMCVLACLGVGETHGSFICCSYRFLTLCVLHLVCVEKKILWKEQHNCLKNYCHKLRSSVILNCSRTSWIKWIVKVLCHFWGAQCFVKASSTKSFVETKKACRERTLIVLGHRQ